MNQLSRLTQHISSDPNSPPGSSWSLTLWLTLSNALSAFLLMSLIAALLYFGLATQLKEQNYHYLHDELETVKELMAMRGGLAPVAKDLGNGHSELDYAKHYIRILDGYGNIILETPAMEKVIPLPGSRLPQSTGVPTDEKFRTRDGRLILSKAERINFRGVPGQQGIVQVALDVTNVEEILVWYRARIYLALSVGFLLCFAVSYLIARRGTRPIREITEVVRRITATNLEERITGKGWPRELNTLSDAMNLMLNRLEDSFTRLYKSATNLSHKLRTPLTILRGEAEVALSRNRTVEELQDVIASSLEEVTRLSRLGENILFLANAEVGKFKVEPSLLDCREEADQVIDYYSPCAEEKGIKLSCEGTACVVADAMLYRKLLAALVSNGLTYNASGGAVALTFRQRENLSGEITVKDSGCGIAAEEMMKIFDRFYRIYATRHMDPHGTGLGLPIAKAIMDLHDGDITLRSAPGEGTTVTAIFPAPPVAPEP